MTEAVFTLELLYFALLMEVRVRGKYRSERSAVRDAAEGGTIRGTLEEMSEGGFHKIDELLVGCVLGPTPLKITHPVG